MLSTYLGSAAPRDNETRGRILPRCLVGPSLSVIGISATSVSVE